MKQTNLDLGVAVLEGTFRKRLVVGELNKELISLVDKTLFITPFKNNVYSIQGVLAPEVKKEMKDLDFSATNSLFKYATEAKKQYAVDNLDLTLSQSVISFYLGVLGAVEFIIKNKNPQVFLQWLSNNKEIDEEYRNSTTFYLNEVFKHL